MYGSVPCNGIFKPLCGNMKSRDTCAILMSFESSIGDDCNYKTVNYEDQLSVFHKSGKPHDTPFNIQGENSQL